MRDLYIERLLRSRLTQGSIISGCVAADYPDAEVAGLVITPRCDMSHGIKVASVHYLPIVTLEDWLMSEGASIIDDILKTDARIALNDWFNLNYKIQNFLDTAVATKETVSVRLEEKKAKKNIKLHFYLFFDLTLNVIKEIILGKTTEKFDADLIKKICKVKRDLIKELAANKMAAYYIIEDWEKGNKTNRVIILREIHQISRDAAKMFEKGFYTDQRDKDFFIENSLNRGTVEKEVVCTIVAEMKSPFVEHVLQRYAHNFTRIGVEDFNFEELDV